MLNSGLSAFFTLMPHSDSVPVPPRLCFGTAQLGLPYGAANRSGMPQDAAAAALIAEALALGVGLFDTAQAYGVAEARLGAMQEAIAAQGAYVITKLDPQARDGAEAEDSVMQSLARLRLERLPVLMLHRAAQLQAGQGPVWQRLLALQRRGRIGALGVSVASPDELREALAVPEIAWVQLPFNIVDTRWSAVPPLLEARPEVTVCARSIFLQGVLSLPPARWPLPAAQARQVAQLLDGFAAQYGRDGRPELCLAFVRAQRWMDVIVLGMETAPQLRRNVAWFQTPPLPEEACTAITAALPALPESFLNPALWPVREAV